MSAYNNIRARIANLEGMIRDGGLCDLGEERARMKIKRLRRELLRIDCETLQSALVLAGRRAGINRLMKWKPKERAAALEWAYAATTAALDGSTKLPTMPPQVAVLQDAKPDSQLAGGRHE